MDNLLCLCYVRKSWSYVNSSVSVSSIFINGQFYLKYYFLHHRITEIPSSPPLSLSLPHTHTLKEIQLSVNCYVSVLIFHQNAKTITVLQFFIFIALGGTSQSLPKNVPYWRQQADVIETSFLSIFLKILFCIIIFSILVIGKHIDM